MVASSAASVGVGVAAARIWAMRSMNWRSPFGKWYA
jgi:hypothetical protein